MADIVGSVKINVDLITKQTLAQAKLLEKEFKNVDIDPKAATNLRTLDKGLQTTVDSLKKLSDAQESVGLHTSAQVTKLSAYKTQLQRNQQEMMATASEISQLTKAEGDNSAEVVNAKANYAALEREQQILVASAGKLEKSVGALTPGMAAAADKATAMGTKLQNAGEKMSSIGGKATMGFTVPIVTAMGVATKSFIDFDSQIKSMGALLDDGHTSAASLKSELNSLGNASKKWSVQYGVSTTQINDGMTEMIKKGYSFHQVMGGMPSILNATKASGDDFNDVMKVSTSTLEQFGLKSNDTATMLKNTQRVTDGLTYVANKTSAGFTDMGYAMEYVGPVAHGLKMSLEETSSAIGLMSNQGIEGEKAGTSLRGALSALLTPSKQNMVGFKALGVSVSDFKKGTLTLPDILDNIKSKSQGMTKQQLQSNLALAFGTEAQSGMNILVNEGGDALRKLTSETKNSTGYTKKLANTMNDTAKANVDKFQQSLKVLGIEAGQNLLPIFTDLLKHAKSLITWFDKLDPQMQKNIVNVGLAVAAGGPLLSILGKTTSGLGSVAKGGTRLLVGAAKLSPIFGTVVKDGGAASTVITSLGVGAAEGGTSLLGLGGSALGTVTGLGALAAAAAPVILGVAAIGTASYFAIKAHQDHEAELAKAKKTMDEYGTNVSDNAKKVIGSFNDLHQEAQNDMALLDTAVGKQSKQLSSDVVTKYSKMADLVEAQFKKTKDSGMNALSDLSGSFGSAGQSWITQVQKGINSKADDQTSKLEKAKKTMSDILKSVDGDFSKLSATQKTKLNEAEQYIDSQVSAFGLAYKDQQALYEAYAKQHGTITDKMYQSDTKSTDDAYSKTVGKANKSYKTSLSELKSLYKNDQISKDQYDQALAMLDAKRNKQQTESSLEYIKTQKAAGDAYNNNGREILGTNRTLNKEFDSWSVDDQGRRIALYKDSVTGEIETGKEWISKAKQRNEQYITDQENAHGTIEKNIAKFQKSQEKAYEAMGMDSDQAVAQAKVDADDLLAESTKSGEKAAVAAGKVHDNYIKSLNKGNLGNVADVAKQWGLDLSDTTSKIDLGKYGEKTAVSFWKDVQSGSKEGYEESKVYFNTILADLKSRNITAASDLDQSTMAELKSGLSSGVLSLKDLKPALGDSIVSLFPNDMSKVSAQEMSTLKQGLKDGVITLSDLNGQFNGKIMGLFPNDLSEIGKDDITTLKKGLKDGSITDSDLKDKYGKQYAAIFKQDLSKLGTNDIQTLKTGLDLGIITKSDLKTKYGKVMSDLFDNKSDFKKIGQKDIDTLATGIDAGIPGAKSALGRLKSAVQSGAKINIAGEGSWTMDTLNKAYADKKISTENYLKVLAAMVQGKTNIDIGASGRATMDHYNDGINGEKQAPINSVTGVATSISEVMNLGKKAVGAGNDTMESFDQGLVDKAKDPIGTAGKTAQAVASNMDQGGSSVNSLSKALDGKASYTATSPTLKIQNGFNKNGTNGRVGSDGLSVVGDGYKPELIDYGNGSMALSPAVPTITNLTAGSQVFSGEDTEKAMPILKMMGMPMFATGSGGSITDWIKNLFGDAFKFLEHPVDNWKKLIDSSFNMNLFPGTSQSVLGSTTKSWEKKQTSWLTKLAASGAANPGGAGVQRWAPMVKRALAMLGLSTSEAMVNKVLKQINTESGGNPKAIGGTDGLSDGRAMGLMQVKPGTFAANGGPKFGSWDNGFASIYAGLHYAKARYGSDLSFLGQGHGYDKGGESFEKQLAWVSEHNQREIHIPDDQSAYSKYLTEEAVKMSFGQQAYVATTAEQSAGLKSTIPVDVPKSAVSVVSGASTGSNEVLGLLKTLVNVVNSKTGSIIVNLDNDAIFNGQYPLIKQALGQDLVMDRTRGGKLI